MNQYIAVILVMKILLVSQNSPILSRNFFTQRLTSHYALWEEVKLIPGFKEVGVLKKSPYLISFTPQGHLGRLCNTDTCGVKLTVSPLSSFPEFKSQILGRRKVWGDIYRNKKKKKTFF